ncbi:excalibur calcium-binding domain-containing protein [Metabacillus litoralis]|uniref:Excalibur calcium-binding domain-containing protein n=1 Tax=Metabacillus litoralis TaxID=152268 RepID=A0A179STH0_9BACI|nr:excalibur calcium-binding domain-containing protein [Metabacillus litoralis]OAS85096.1 hypothetical protein A6K24_06185 [Metabacillus litoralis]
MEKWLGKRPTMGQKALVKYEKLLLNVQHTVLKPDEKVLKIIEAECDKTSKRELDGVLVLTNESLLFISKHEHFSYKYSQISDIDVRKDGKDKNEWQLTLRIGLSNRYFDDIKKNDDSQEFIEILEYMIVNPNKEIQTTVTHDFDYFLHAKRLEDLRNKNVKITSFLMKRDNMGFSKNGERLLRELHKDAKFIVEGFFKEKKEKKGNFLVVDKSIFLYEYNDKERTAKLIYTWPFLFFSKAIVDHFAMKTEIHSNEGTLVLNSTGKTFATILSSEGVDFDVKKRKWHQKILGFRSGKMWKKAIASLVYILSFLLILTLAFGDETTEPTSTKPTTEEVTDSNNQKAEEERLAEEQLKKEEQARLAEEQRKKEEQARLAEEQRKKEEQARLAEEQRKKEEQARLAEEQRKKEEQARLAEEQRKREEEARLAEEQQQTNVYFKNCDAARAAGAAPVNRGEPGYGKHLDRDGDGTGCDR